MSWRDIQGVAGTLGTVAIVVGVCIAYYEIGEIKDVSRKESALAHCNLFLSNEFINEMASYTLKVSRGIEREYPGIFSKNFSQEKLKESRSELDEASYFKNLDMRNFYQLANFYSSAIDGVEDKVYDEEIIWKCLSDNISCFYEKYGLRLGLFEKQSDMMVQFRNYLNREEEKRCPSIRD